MTLKQAIEKAIEGGWKYESHIEHFEWLRTYPEQIDFVSNRKTVFIKCPENILLDPLFWQCLGKAMGWKEQTEDPTIFGVRRFSWLEKQHQLIDHLASGQSVERFFEELK